MSEKNKKSYEDDGRTIADMSMLSSNSWKLKRPEEDEKEEESENPRPWEQTGLTKEERRWYILGTLKAALMIAGVYIVGIGLVGWLLLTFWSMMN